MKHKSVGNKLTKASWEAEDVHMIGSHVAANVLLVSIPPSGKCRVINVYYDPIIEKAIFEYEDMPEP